MDEITVEDNDGEYADGRLWYVKNWYHEKYEQKHGTKSNEKKKKKERGHIEKREMANPRKTHKSKL